MRCSLHRILNKVDHALRFFSSLIRALRFQYFLLLSFSGFLRASEALSLNLEDLSFVDDYLVVLIRSSKTDQLRQGNRVFISKNARPPCPVRTVQRYLSTASAKASPLGNEEHLFPRLGGPRCLCPVLSTRLSYTSIRDELSIVLNRTAIWPVAK